MRKEIQINFASEEHETRFRKILGEMSDARTETTATRVVSFFKPKNTFAFEQKLHAAGMKNCRAANDAVKHLAKNPDENLMIVVNR